MGWLNKIKLPKDEYRDNKGDKRAALEKEYEGKIYWGQEFNTLTESVIIVLKLLMSEDKGDGNMDASRESAADISNAIQNLQNAQKTPELVAWLKKWGPNYKVYSGTVKYTYEWRIKGVTGWNTKNVILQHWVGVKPQ